MSARWVVERQHKNSSHELLQLVEVYTQDENKELVKEENKHWTHERELILVESMKFATDIEEFK